MILDLCDALRMKCGFQVLSEAPSESDLAEGHVRIVGRVPPSGSPQWVLVSHALLLAAKSAPWGVDISKTLFLRPDNRLVYTWRLLIEVPTNLGLHLRSMAAVVRAAPRPRGVQLTEFPLPGASANRNAGGGPFVGRGAVPTKME